MIKFNYNTTYDPRQINNIITEIQNDPMGGWFNLPKNPDAAEIAHIQTAAMRIRGDSKYLVCIGIGGSYLGHKALLDIIRPNSQTKILFAGNSLSSKELKRVIDEIGDADFSINVISKSGTTTEPAIAFRILKQKLIDKYGPSEAWRRIYATTDAGQGSLYNETITKKYEHFIIPNNVGGRYSVLTSVGLLPLAVAGVNIQSLITGANTVDYAEAAKYACTRHAFYTQGMDVEVLATFDPDYRYFTEWWKQLFGESEGKNSGGIFPASAIYTTDLHSLGQYMQQGRRNIFETIIRTASEADSVVVPAMPEDLDNLNYLAEKSLAQINEQAINATVNAHRAGGIPVLEISIAENSIQALGALIFFFELSCAISAKLNGINPFDQPGVEAYKTEMFRLLGKPGFEAYNKR